MKSKEIRRKFIKFFEEKGHKHLPPSPLVPDKIDPSVLFTSAGMQQFKTWFSGGEKAKYSRVVTIQSCLRTSDIDEVGDETHLTFFEMLGNFSFGDYFKKEAIEWGWEFLTDKKWLGIDPKRISATYFDQRKARKPMAIIFDTDNESLEILKTIKGLKKIEGQGDDNFWTLGQIGSPGGPTVEFYVDEIEVWNLVFNEAVLKKDPSKHWFWDNITKGVDTGMGLERIAAVMQGKTDVFTTDLYQVSIKEIEKLSKLKYGAKSDDEYIKEGEQCWVDTRKYFRRVADHLRAAAFVTSERLEPSNLGQGYILRRLIRRTARYAKILNLPDTFCGDIVKVIIDEYGKIYPKLKDNEDFIFEQLEKEKERFKKPLNMVEQYKIDLRAAVNDKAIKKIKNIAILSDPKTASGKYVYENYQTYGVPADLAKEVVEEMGLEFDQKEYNKAQQEHRKESKKGEGSKFGAQDQEKISKLHTATHIMHEALRQVLGNHVEQRGQDINADRLRFDFSHTDKMTDEEIKKVEGMVNEVIAKNVPITCEEVSVEEAKKQGARAQFLDKYSGKVTMYSVNDFSKELCKGPHVKNTSELGHFKILKEESSSAGVRRIRATLE